MSLIARGMDKADLQAPPPAGADSPPVLSLFFPCYNEEQSIPSAIDSALQILPGKEAAICQVICSGIVQLGR